MKNMVLDYRDKIASLLWVNEEELKHKGQYQVCTRKP